MVVNWKIISILAPVSYEMGIDGNRSKTIWFVLFLISVTLLTAYPGPACAGTVLEEYEIDNVLVSSIIDGDSIIINENESEYVIRLWGIDAPEYDQPGADGAKDALARLIHKKYITVTVKDRDTYGRLVATARIGDLSINEYLVRHGHAWVHMYYCHSGPCDDWYGLEKEARERGAGLWKYKQPIPPWRWKQMKKK